MSTPEENPKENDLVLAVVIPEGDLIFVHGKRKPKKKVFPIVSSPFSTFFLIYFLTTLIPSLKTSGATAGSTFHVSVENRFFEVTTPEGVQPGQTINLIVRAEQQDESKFKSVVDVRDAVLNQAKQGADALGITERVQGLDEKYHVSERAKSITNTAVTRVSDFDTRFAISSRVNSILASLDSRLHVQAAAIKTGEFIIGCKSMLFNLLSSLISLFMQILTISLLLLLCKRDDLILTSLLPLFFTDAREIDARLAVSATSAKVVVASANVILGNYFLSIISD